MNFSVLDILALVVTQVTTAAGVYAALKSDVREAVVRASHAQDVANKAHDRIDKIHMRD